MTSKDDAITEARAAAQRYPDRLTCGLCTHKVNRHNSIAGCDDCDCMATPGEANIPRDTPAAPVHYPKKSTAKPPASIFMLNRAWWNTSWDRPELEESVALEEGYFVTHEAAQARADELKQWLVKTAQDTFTVIEVKEHS
jgi:hypothetical protein